MMMNMEDEKLALILAKNLLENEELDLIDTANIRDWFWFKFMEIYESGNKELAKKWVDIFEKLELVFTNKDLTFKANGFHTKNYSGIFLTLAQILSLKYGIKRLAGEKINKEEFKKSFNETFKKLKF